MMENDEQDLAALLRALGAEQLFPQYVDLKDRQLQELIVSDSEPPTFSDRAFDAARAYQRTLGYLTWTGLLNEHRKRIGSHIRELLEANEDAEPAALAGLQEIAFHLIAIAADSAAKQFNVLATRLGINIEPDIAQDIGMFGTIRNDFEHPDDRRGISDKYGKQIYEVDREEVGGTRGFNWKHAPGDYVASRKGLVPMSDEGIVFHQGRVRDGLSELRERCIRGLVDLAETSEREDVIRWMLVRRIKISVGSSKSYRR